jgi:molybdopterin-guanine dinucleotide biosynthesis protein A
MSQELFGLVLAGGHSTRMRRDKAVLDYGGKPQLARAMELLTPLVSRAFVSVRPDQQQDPQRGAYAQIVDLRPGIGPLAGIEAAQRSRPQDAWLVLACDLPYLSTATLQHLIARRDRSRLATAYRSQFDGKPEPLCAIYEPDSREALRRWIDAGRNCPRTWMAAADVALLDLPEPHALDNMNTAEEYAAANNLLVGASASGGGAAAAVRRRLQVRYFALLREQAGRGAEDLQTEARTPHELYAQLQRERGLKLAPQFLRVAVNDEFGDWQQPLRDGDTVAFLPPVAGG